MTSFGFKLSLILALLLLATDALAARRGLRVDGFGDTWALYEGANGIGSANCPGTTAGSGAANTLISKLGFTFSGRASTAYLVDDYCQVANPGTLTSANYFYADEAGLSSLFGNNPGNAITGIRYAFFDRPRFDFDTPATGFQWAFYTFPSGVTVATLYGLQTVTLTNTSYISGSVWSGQNGYNGEYYCFRNNVYIGSWNGLLSDTGSACLRSISEKIFANGFDP
ncbi:MAG: hypothetical protein ABI866_00555 [Dokdonella sp.]